ncbi:toxin-antitoxin system YwqK family antitoxin [Cytophaga aurantiaca]|uniref:toxin-antitoxin system YwqK family antitoxin n=1 Tax=Cytophaga aurantiaca TaxID=29530 RepID=UPI0003A74B35|nr:toxin-antitoxin system YwqK family antitoxin [Cytophaga aurantiaca]
MKRLIGVLFFLITSLVSQAQLQEVFTIKKIIVGERHILHFMLYPYLFNYEMDGLCVKQGDFANYFLSETNDTILIAKGKYKNNSLYDTCKWFSIDKKTLYANAFFKEDRMYCKRLFTVYYSGIALCERGDREGLFELYYPDTTQLKERSIYMDNKLNGSYETYYLNGQLAKKYEYSNGFGSGPFIEYDDKGFLQKKGYYTAKTNDKYEEYYSNNGQIKTRIFKTNDNTLIYDSCLFENGTVKYRYYYGDKGDSSFVYYYGGQLKYETIHDDKGDGYSKSYYENGNIEDYTPYKNYKDEGTVLRYYENGNKKEEKNYVAGSMNGKYIEYYETGIVEREAMYLKYTRNGLQKEYYKNGKLASSSYYSNGLLNGTKKEYNEKGQLTRNSLYENGSLISESFYENGKEIFPIKAPANTNHITTKSQDMEGGNRKVWFDEPHHRIIIDESIGRDCVDFPDLKPVFNRDTFLTHFRNYLTSPEGKCLKNISTSIDFYITTTPNKLVSARQKYFRTISNVTYHTILNKKQQKAFLQFLINEKLVYDDSRFNNSVYKLNYELSIIPKALSL